MYKYFEPKEIRTSTDILVRLRGIKINKAISLRDGFLFYSRIST